MFLGGPLQRLLSSPRNLDSSKDESWVCTCSRLPCLFCVRRRSFSRKIACHTTFCNSIMPSFDWKIYFHIFCNHTYATKLVTIATTPDHTKEPFLHKFSLTASFVSLRFARLMMLPTEFYGCSSGQNGTGSADWSAALSFQTTPLLIWVGGHHTFTQ